MVVKITNYSFSGIIPMNESDKPLVWIGNSKKDLMTLPIPVRKFFGHALHFAQMGEQHPSAKPLKGFGGSGVLELLEDDSAGTYRAVYTVRFTDAIFVLHCFQKKSHRGIATPKKEIDVIQSRLKVAEVLGEEMRNAKRNDPRS